MKTLIVRYASLALLPILMSAAMAATFTVNNTSDSGINSLRDAISQANANVVADIQFNIPGDLATIPLLSPLPPLTARTGVKIDGFTQPGASVGAMPTGHLTRPLRIRATLPAEDPGKREVFRKTGNCRDQSFGFE